MDILWVSDSPFFNSAYGIQTRITTPKLAKLGHKMTVFGTTHLGVPMVADGVTTLGGFRDPIGSDMIAAHTGHLKPDIVITLKDPYVYRRQAMTALAAPWLPIVPVDTVPLDAANAGALDLALAAVALTRQSEKLISDAGYQTFYIPHGYDPDIFKPLTQDARAALRAQYGLGEKEFIALFVGVNNSYPSRKGIDLLLEAWTAFADRHKDATLWLHTFAGGDLGGIDVDLMIQTLGTEKSQVIITDKYEYVNGLRAEQMASLYQMADVLIQPSLGEGFCLPMLEAQACGTPVIATRWGAMEENNFGGRFLEGDTFPLPRGGRWKRPDVKGIIHALGAAYDERTKLPAKLTARKEIAVKKAKAFEIDHVVETYWKPALAQIERLIGGELIQGETTDGKAKDQNAGDSQTEAGREPSEAMADGAA